MGLWGLGSSDSAGQDGGPATGSREPCRLEAGSLLWKPAFVLSLQQIGQGPPDPAESPQGLTSTGEASAEDRLLTVVGAHCPGTEVRERPGSGPETPRTGTRRPEQGRAEAVGQGQAGPAEESSPLGLEGGNSSAQNNRGPQGAAGAGAGGGPPSEWERRPVDSSCDTVGV